MPAIPASGAPPWPLDSQRQPSRHRRMDAASLPGFGGSRHPGSAGWRDCLFCIGCRISPQISSHHHRRRWRQPHSSLAQSRIVIPGVLRASRSLNAVAPGHTDSWHKKKVSPAQEPSFVPPQWQAPHHVRHFCILTEKRVPRPLSERGALSGFKVQDATKNGCTLQIQPRDKATGFRRHFQTPRRGLKADQISKKPEKPHTKPTEKLTRTKHNIMNFINLYHIHRVRIGITKKAR